MIQEISTRSSLRPRKDWIRSRINEKIPDLRCKESRPQSTTSPWTRNSWTRWIWHHYLILPRRITKSRDYKLTCQRTKILKISTIWPSTKRTSSSPSRKWTKWRGSMNLSCQTSMHSALPWIKKISSKITNKPSRCSRRATCHNLREICSARAPSMFC